jgi:methylenetetrahydrofolate dehydrogenase (NADP+)/methenyltetrahydrofolate cyclohydrolase
VAAQILDGKSLAASIRTALKERVTTLVQRGVRPGLAVVLAGDDPASRVYVRNKRLAATETGVHSELIELPATVGQRELRERIERLNDNRAIHGILVQLPLPKPIDSAAVLDAITPAKDVDGFHEMNLGALLAGRPAVVPCTPAGVMRLIEHARIALAGRHAVVIGRSNIVGKPLAQLLLQKDATVTICHSKSRDLSELTRQADVLIAAVGRPKLVRADMVKPGACVIDVGVNRLEDGKLAGDVDFEAVKEVAGWITPVPGGVGPMTIAMLLENCIRAASRELEPKPAG